MYHCQKVGLTELVSNELKLVGCVSDMGGQVQNIPLVKLLKTWDHSPVLPTKKGVNIVAKSKSAAEVQTIKFAP